MPDDQNTQEVAGTEKTGGGWVTIVYFHGAKERGSTIFLSESKAQIAAEARLRHFRQTFESR